MAQRIRVGVAGQGRSGFGIHVETMAKLSELFEVVAVADPMDERRFDVRKFFPNARGYFRAEEVMGDPDVELLVVATPSYLHTTHAIEGLKAGKGVLCEKPFSLTLKDSDRTVAEAKKQGKFLAPFQQRRYEPSLAKIKELIGAGVLGEIVNAKVTLHNFGRRWDWQTLKEFGGGQLHNNAPHIIDLGLQLFGPKDPEVIFGDLQRTLASGDAEDHVKIVLKAKGQPTVEIELTQTDAFANKELWFIEGTRGTLRGTDKMLEWKSVDWKDYPARSVDPKPTEGRVYNSEKLNFAEGKWEMEKDYEGNPVQFYRGLYRSFREGEELRVKLAEIRRQIGIIEHVRKTCPV